MFKIFTGKTLLFLFVATSLVLVSFGSGIPFLESYFADSSDSETKLSVTSPTQSGTLIGKKKYTVAMPVNGEYQDLDEGKEQWFAIGALTETSSELRANGVSQAHFYQSKVFRASVQLNVEPAPDDMFYQAWLINRETEKRITLGHMRRRFGDSRHYAQFEIQRDLRSYDKIEVTLEEDDGNPEPGRVIATGTLRYANR